MNNLTLKKLLPVILVIGVGAAAWLGWQKLQPQGPGPGFVSGNVIRFETTSAMPGIWLLRCISVGIATHPDDSMSYQQRGDA